MTNQSITGTHWATSATPPNDWRVELALLNNTHWYQALFAAHGLTSENTDRAWWSFENAPPFHSNLVVRAADLSPAELASLVAAIDERPRPGGWSIKDSHACLTLESLGFNLKFAAEWLWRDAQVTAIHRAPPMLDWRPMDSAAQLQAWEAAWWGDSRNETPKRRARQFPDVLLASPDHAFFAGHLDNQIVAGAIANRSPGAVGLSNLFAPPAFAEEAWAAVVDGITRACPGLPIVGYERGDDLVLAHQLGFESVGALCVWRRASA